MEGEDPVSKVITFSHNPAYVALPEHSTTQQARGERQFKAVVANAAELRLRIKRVPAEGIVTAMQKYRTYGKRVGSRKNGEPYRMSVVDFESLPGEIVRDEVIKPDVALNKSFTIPIDWNALEGSAQGALFIHAEAVPHPDLPEQHRQGSLVSQSLIQLTDIGVLLKQPEGDRGLIYTFSMEGGNPLAGAEILALNDERHLLGKARSGEDGTARFPGNARWLLVRKDDDQFVIDARSGRHEIYTWRHGIRRSYDDVSKRNLEVFAFTDRPVYKPGEPLFLKVMARTRYVDSLDLPPNGLTGEVRIEDPDYREVSTHKFTLSREGIGGPGNRTPGGRGHARPLQPGGGNRRPARGSPTAPHTSGSGSRNTGPTPSR